MLAGAAKTFVQDMDEAVWPGLVCTSVLRAGHLG